jgi:UrcA family protein
MFRTAILATAAVLALSISAAQAADAPSQASVTVNFADLNLGHATDAQVLAVRIAAAAKSVCLSTGHVNDLHDCEEFAVTNAIASIENGLDHNVRVHLTMNAGQEMANP